MTLEPVIINRVCRHCAAGSHRTAAEHNQWAEARLADLRALAATYPAGDLPLRLAAMIGGLTSVGGGGRKRAD